MRANVQNPDAVCCHYTNNLIDKNLFTAPLLFTGNHIGLITIHIYYISPLPRILDDSIFEYALFQINYYWKIQSLKHLLYTFVSNM